MLISPKCQQKPDSDLDPALNLGDLDLTTDEFILDEVDSKFAFNCTLCICILKHHTHAGLIKNVYDNNCIHLSCSTHPGQS